MGRDRRTLVLLAEDEPDLLELVQLTLEDAGMAVVPARDGARALNLLELIEPDVVVADMMMPVLDGFGLLRAYADSANAAPVLAMSSFAPYLEEARELGAAEVIEKPFEPSALVEAVQRLASRAPPEEAKPLRAEEPGYESARLRALVALGLDEPMSDPALERFVERVAAHFGVPIALVSVVTSERWQWAAQCGLDEAIVAVGGISRDDAFCSHAVVARSALVIQDSRQNPVFRENEFIRAARLRFYAGVPILSRTGEAVGTLCLMDREPRSFSHFDLELLSLFARSVMAALEQRERASRAEIPHDAFRYIHYLADPELDIFGRTAFADLVVVEGVRSASVRQPVVCAVLGAPAEELAGVVRELHRRRPSSFVGRLDSGRLGWLIPGAGVSEALREARAVVGARGDAAALDLAAYSGGAIGAALGDAERQLSEREAGSEA